MRILFKRGDSDYNLGEGRVAAKTRRPLYWTAHRNNASGKLVALGQAVNTVVEPQTE